MHGHIYANQRFEQANENLGRLKTVFEKGDLNSFIEIVESEALSLHAMMMTSNPYFVLMKPNTLKIIEKVWAFRDSSKTHLCFTLDAGANVHLLYPKNEKQQVLEFIEGELSNLCENGQYLVDSVGKGAERQ